MSKLLALCASDLRPGSALLCRAYGGKIQIVWQGSTISTCLGTNFTPSCSICKALSPIMQEAIVAKFGKKSGRMEEGPPAIAVT